MGYCGRLLTTLALLLPLSACILTPGKFTSTLDIGRDRSFTFTYVGEVIAPPPSSLPGKIGDDDARPSPNRTAGAKGPAKSESASDRARMVALADTLAKEHGYRSVKYLGNYHFAVDYAVSGRLTHGFVFPFNIDGEVVIPFLAIELRGADRVRVKAPGFANDDSRGGGEMGAALGGLGGAGDAKASELDGSFTLTTNAEIISQNLESGPTTLPNGRRQIIWRATPETKDAPTVALKFDALP
ncbi:hypothetical protein LWE61_19815 [Sphingobium sufflavum]|nr:hypothetical protein [Sphingobium sufflavum]MCE7798778.1 hypothetical protein [Sphingobium sufflavum]